LDVHTDPVEGAQQLHMAVEVQLIITEMEADGPCEFCHSGWHTACCPVAERLGEDAVVHGGIPWQPGRTHLFGDQTPAGLCGAEQIEPPRAVGGDHARLLTKLCQELCFGYGPRAFVSIEERRFADFRVTRDP